MKMPDGTYQMTVGELKRALEYVPDDDPVLMWLPARRPASEWAYLETVLRPEHCIDGTDGYSFISLFPAPEEYDYRTVPSEMVVAPPPQPWDIEKAGKHERGRWYSHRA